MKKTFRLIAAASIFICANFNGAEPTKDEILKRDLKYILFTQPPIIHFNTDFQRTFFKITEFTSGVISLNTINEQIGINLLHFTLTSCLSCPIDKDSCIHKKIVAVLCKFDDLDVKTRQKGTIPLELANGKFDLMKMLLEKGANPNAQPFFHKGSALHSAASKGDVNLVKLLLHHGAQKTIRDKEGYTPYDIAVRRGQNKESPAELFMLLNPHKLES